MSHRKIRRRPAATPRRVADFTALPIRRLAVVPFPATPRTVSELDWLRECQQASEHAKAFEMNAAVRVLAAAVREIDTTATEALLVRVEGTDELALLEVQRRDGRTVTEVPDRAGATPRTDLVDEVAATLHGTDADAAMWLFRAEDGEGWLLDIEGALGGPSPIAEAFAA